jgi:ribonucleoside-diphosphate reductase alpha subunit
MKLANDMSIISKYGGGIGVHYSNVRAAGSYIAGTNGISTGILPQLNILESAIKCWNQGGTRKGSACIYVNIWHKDILQFIEMRLPSGNLDTRCPRLFNAIWANNLFFERYAEYLKVAKTGGDVQWTLVDCEDYPGLDKLYGEEFRAAYAEIEARGLGISIPISIIIGALVQSIIITGGPFICNADAANECSGQKNVGSIDSSNLCTEIYLHSNAESYACCTLASINLPSFIINVNGRSEYDLKGLAKTVRSAIRALDRVVTVNKYPLKKCETNSMDLRPLGLGLQGLADTFYLLGLDYLSDEAAKLDRAIFETMYYEAVDQSADLATKLGAYPKFEGSPMSQGKFHFELFEQFSGNKYNHERKAGSKYGELDWETLRAKMRLGLRNSTLLALMPTESTSKVHDNSACIEIPISHTYTNDSDIVGRVAHVAKYLIRDLMARGAWTKDRIHQAKLGESIPLDDHPDLKVRYADFCSVSKNAYMQRVAEKQYMVDQGISLNLWFEKLNSGVVNKYIMKGYELGLKTINYYVKQRNGESNAVKIGSSTSKESEADVCRRDNPESCLMCQ